MTATPQATNPAPVSRSAFRAAGLLLAVDRTEPGTHEVTVRGVIDVDGGADVARGDTVRLDWPYEAGQDARFRPLVVPVELRMDGSYRATSAGLDQRQAVRLLAGLPDDDVQASRQQVTSLYQEADAVADYSWDVDPESDGRTVTARLARAYKGDPPETFDYTSPDTDAPGGPWTFLDGLRTNSRAGTVFLAREADGGWRPLGDLMPWHVSRGLLPTS